MSSDVGTVSISMLRRAVEAITALFVSLSALHAAEFDYLDIRDNSVFTTHQAEYRLRIDNAFQPLGELHHQQISRDLLFNVSFAAFANDDDIILIHAETLADRTGVLDYSHLPQSKLDGVDFGFREQCVPAEAEASLKTNPEANFVKERGFKLALPFQLTQFLAASPDGNAEVVISYGRRVVSCADVPGIHRIETRRRIETSIDVEQIH